ncbi:hypothetical protein [Micrococcus sp.]|uniref:hypothetical protein n=1 Tax=Micrococcus sp. TaxID=1271 RepID=UPI002A918CFE|nr:hypothetical protein [Micrococcus sp.]MDY6056072.1 hypothetical protein [Micrococcus sp.]
MAETSTEHSRTEGEQGGAEDTSSSEPERAGSQAWPYAVAALLYLVLPLLLGTLAAPATATVLLLVVLIGGPLVLGALDAVVYRPAWTFAVLTGLFALVGLWIYTNPGTWIYAIGVVLLTRLSGAIAGALRPARNR